LKDRRLVAEGGDDGGESEEEEEEEEEEGEGEEGKGEGPPDRPERSFANIVPMEDGDSGRKRCLRLFFAFSFLAFFLCFSLSFFVCLFGLLSLSPFFL